MRFLILALLLSSCSAALHIKRACKKDPAICQAKPADTVIFEKPVIITKLDTVYRNDTTVVFKSKDSVILRLVYKAGRIDTVKAECPPNQVITISEPYPVPVPPSFAQKARNGLMGAGIFAGVVLLLYALIRALKG